MNRQEIIQPEFAAGGGADDFNFIDFLTVLAKRKKPIIGVTAAVAVMAVAVSLVLPEVYSANAKILPPQPTSSSASALLSQLGPVGALAGVSGLKNPNDLYVGMLKSRRVGDQLIAKFDLLKVYDKGAMDKTRLKLQENTQILSGKDNLINIAVEDRDPKRAALLANAYVDELMALTKVLAVTEAGQRRVFFERQLEQAKDNLALAESKLKVSLDRGGVISVDADTTAMVATVGRMRAQIAAKEIELGAMRAFVTNDHQEYKQAQEQLASLRAQYAKLQGGQANLADEVNTGAAAQSGLDSIKTLRDVKYYQMLYELLGKQYEVARLDEAKNSSVVQLLDSAIVPERKLKPKRAFIVLVATLLAFMTMAGWAFLRERKERVRDPATVEKWQKLKSYL